MPIPAPHDDACRFQEGLRRARLLLPELNALALRLLALADQMAAARESLLASSLRLQAAADQLAAAAESLRSAGDGLPGSPAA